MTDPENRASGPGFDEWLPVTPTEEDRVPSVTLLANVVSWVLDEALLERVGTFSWEDSTLAHPVRYVHAVPVNRWERAAEHFWDTLFSAPVSLGSTDQRRLALLLEDIFKAAGRCRAGDLSSLMQGSVWSRLLDALSRVAPRG